jgi:hypothetical protein
LLSLGYRSELRRFYFVLWYKIEKPCQRNKRAQSRR